MIQLDPNEPRHPILTRRDMLQAGTIGLLGLSMAQVEALRAQAAGGRNPASSKSRVSPPRAVIYIFLTGGLGQHDSFDMKPEAPDEVRGEFTPVETKTPGIHICEHMPMLAQRSDKWALVRSLSHPQNGHQPGTMVMLTGRTPLPPGFRSSKIQSTDWPSIAAVGGYGTGSRNNMPPSVVLPEKVIHNSQGEFPGQGAGMMGDRHDPWFVEATDKPHAYHAYSGAFPGYLFNLHKGQKSDREDFTFQAPNLSLPEGILSDRLRSRVALLKHIERQRRDLEKTAEAANFDRFRQGAVSLLADPKVQWAFDVKRAEAKTLERYGNNSFGWSLLMARRLIETGVNLVQVNLGNMGSWDLHGNNFPLLKKFLFPPTDLAVTALLDDLEQSGLLDSTLVVMAGEFGRTPKIFNGAPDVYKLPGRGHWGPVQSVLFAGGGIQGGTVVGSSDKKGAYPASAPQMPENFAATIYQALGIPRTAHWYDAANRPYHIYHADPIEGLMA